MSDSEFAQQEADAAFGGESGEEGDFSGRCAAVLGNGKRCPNAALPGTKYCGVPAHQDLALHEPAEAPAPAEPTEADAAADADTTDGEVHDEG